MLSFLLAAQAAIAAPASGPVRSWDARMPLDVPTAVNGVDGSALAVDAGLYHVCTITETGAVLCWVTTSSDHLGLADPPGPEARAEPDHVLADAHAEELRGQEVTDLVQADRQAEADQHEHDATQVQQCFHMHTLLVAA